MQFIDKAKIYIEAGKGGDGTVAFRREAHVPKGGPAGGDGGKGGSIIFEATTSLSTLLDLKYKRVYKARPGGNGMAKKMHGADAGYIGSHTALELIRTGESVIIADNLATGHIEAVPKDAKFYLGDLHDKAFLDNIFENEQIDAVIHFAAYSLVGESVVNPLKYYDNNLCGTKILLGSMVEHHIDKIVFSSTAATYGEPENIPILETDRTQPTNTYGETKLAMEKMFYWTSKAHGLRYVSLRYFNACGADKSGKIGEAHNPESHLIPLILQVPNGKRESISIYGTDYDTPDGTCIRDYIHVTDLAQAHILAVKYLKNGNKSNIFNLGNGVGYSVKEVIDKTRKVTGHPIPAIETPKRAGDPARLVASSEKARKILGWNPVHDSLEEIISDAWNWHKNHPDGF